MSRLSRIRIGFFLTLLIGTIYASVGLFTTMLDFGIGVCVAMVGVIGFGACEYVDGR